MRQAVAEDLATVVREARAGDERAWSRLVEAYDPRLRMIARRFRIPPDQAGDLVQATWLQLFNGIGRLQCPEAVGAWLAVTMRRFCLHAVAGRDRECPVTGLDEWLTQPGEAPEADLLRAEQAATVRRALARLPERQRRLLWQMATDPDARYTEISARLDIPVGAIGPTRARALGRLRRLLLDEDRAAHYSHQRGS
ncbi:RNA polymerase sigma-E factor [Actinoplanes sp. SE50]|uniref:RNA polymerase sigma factor n=1 Tax=unclassified Actinoplanes TaxID=2626549 RepID=UPI00023EC0D1|nr:MULTISPECIES: sigma-70 family RNA polymerase sigma factor [unclassified Actinoplanes]AEV84074.1 RNA polymerase sigma-E factor [Actinoplanes sp. SE50/110]ATO82466.1 RNA polymerase sigma-E factor [Actinoplanes sp. SE50]SLL99873.1 RNA polymerase sigma-E factor [Actinoplanes sp. SE50/110]